MTEKEKERLYERLGDKIRQYRLGTSLTQTALGSKVGLSRSSIVNIEKGRQHAPLHVLWDIAEAVGVEISELIPQKHELTPSHGTDPVLARRIAEELEDGNPETIRQLAEFIETSRTDA